VQPEKAQTQPETPYAVHYTTAVELGEEVSGKTVSEHRGEGRVFQFAPSYRDTGEDLVPEPQGQSQAAARGRDREAENGRGGRGPAAPSAVRQPSPAALFPAPVRAVRPPAPATVAPVAPAYHGASHSPGPATTATATAAAATATGTAADAPAGRRTPAAAAAAAALVPVAPRWQTVRDARVAHPVDGRWGPGVHHERLVHQAPRKTVFKDYTRRVSNSYYIHVYICISI